MKNKYNKKKTIKMLPALHNRIWLIGLILWLACMFTITHAVAEILLTVSYDNGITLNQNKWRTAEFSQLDDQEQLPGFEEYVIWNAVNMTYINDEYQNNYNGWQMLPRKLITFDMAAAVFDQNSTLVAYPSNFLTFPYYYEGDFLARDFNTKGYAVCVLDRQMEQRASQVLIMDAILLDELNTFHRLTGTLDNGYFTVYRIEYCLNENDGVWDQLEWIEVSLDIEMPENAEIVTLYTETSAINANYYNESRSFTYEGRKMSSLGEFISEAGTETEYSYKIQNGLMDFVYMSSNSYADPSKPVLEVKYKLSTALLASPWKSAMYALRNIYFITLTIWLLFDSILYRILKKQVVGPITTVNLAIKHGNRTPLSGSLKFKEQAELYQNYNDMNAKLIENKDKIVRLEKTVSYTEEAELNRRQMTANIAHELKTPLAVIHSYAEGLREHIADDKRDQYLDVILSESKRMDGMVLEMLDLSRLEAGKVKLSREFFSLSELTITVFDRLEYAAQAKDLHITFELNENCMVHADLQRIEQVITNYAVNAIKYTPLRGDIHVAVLRKRRGRETTFTIENDSEPLSPEALEKVWSSFYRTEKSHSSGGTGLGLAIAKSIIELHGGKCSANNTETGVSFSFTLHHTM